MGCMRKHIYRLDPANLIMILQYQQITCLGGGVTAYIYNLPGGNRQQALHHARMHASPGGIGNNDLRTTLFRYKFFREHIFHVSGKKDRISDAVQCRILPGIRSEEHKSELQSLMRIAYDVLCLTKKNTYNK